MAGDEPFSAFTIGQEFENISLEIPEKKLKNFEPGLDAAVIEKNIIQRLCTFALQESIFPNLTLMLGGIVQPATVSLPLSWKKKLQENGVPIRKYSSNLLWMIRLIRMYIAGVFRALKLLFWTWTTNVITPDEPYSVIFIPRSDMMGEVIGPRNYDFLSTFISSPAHLPQERSKWVVLNRENNKVCPPDVSISRYGLPKLPTILDRVIFTFQLFSRIISDFIFLTMGEWWRAILQDERIFYSYIRRLKSTDLASSYVYTSANLLIRPLWTYAAHANGSRIMLVFISTNFYTFTSSGYGNCPINVGLKSMTWPTYAIWGPAQRNYLKFAGHTNAEFVKMGAIGYNEDLKRSCILNENTIAFFDVSPIRNILLAERGYPNPYYIWSAQKSIEDIIHIATQLGLKVVIKSKSREEESITRSYRNFITKYQAKGLIQVVSPEVSAHRIIQESMCVVSAPFTSTAHIARYFNKPSVFYDPLNALANKRSLGDGINILCGMEDLRSWLVAECLNNTKNIT